MDNLLKTRELASGSDRIQTPILYDPQSMLFIVMLSLASVKSGDNNTQGGIIHTCEDVYACILWP